MNRALWRLLRYGPRRFWRTFIRPASFWLWPRPDLHFSLTFSSIDADGNVIKETRYDPCIWCGTTQNRAICSTCGAAR